MKNMIRKILYPLKPIKRRWNLYIYSYLDGQFRKKGAPDNLPLPSPDLVYLVSGGYDTRLFYYKGIIGSLCIKDILQKNGFDINKFDSILDFGCGCGRVMRHGKTLKGPKLYGADLNPVLVPWCKKSLTFADFKSNKLYEKLDYGDEKFDFIYAISVFTHLTEDLQNFWIGELTRILKPGGLLLITTHGKSRIQTLRPEEKEKFYLGQVVVRNKEYAGANICNAFHPEQYVRNVLAKGLTVIDFAPDGAKDANQDIFLLKKPKKVTDAFDNSPIKMVSAEITRIKEQSRCI